VKNLFLYIFLFYNLCNLPNTANAVSMKHNGQGQIELSDKIIQEFHLYLKTDIRSNPINFFITSDHRNSFEVIIKDTSYKGYSGSGPIVRNLNKCEVKFKQPCFLFANQRFIVWNNGVNPIKKEKSKLSRKISNEELIIKLTELGFLGSSELTGWNAID